MCQTKMNWLIGALEISSFLIIAQIPLRGASSWEMDKNFKSAQSFRTYLCEKISITPH